MAPLITDTRAFRDGSEAFDYARSAPPGTVKAQVAMPGGA